MGMKITIYFTLFSLLIILYGCGSGQYDIEKGNYPDTTYKSTGAKLKGTYRVRTSPKFTLLINGGMNLGMAELSSNYESVFEAEQFLDGQNFGVKNGFGFSATGKIPLHKKGNVRLNMSAGYNRFQSNLFAKESPYGDVSYNVYTFGVGLENCFAPILKLKPYVAGELQANFISGKANVNDLNTGTTRHITFKNSFRIGYMIYSGLEFMLSNKFGLNIGLKVTNSNQILKKSKVDEDPNNVSVRDKKIEGDNLLEFAGFKNFTYTSFFAGVNFYFGVKNVLYKF